MSIERVFAESSLFRICFVCTGNICRSPMAEVVFTRLAVERGLADRILITSAGLSDYHVGETADDRTVRALTAAGYQPDHHRAKHFKARWFDMLDLVIAFDRSQERALRSMSRSDEQTSKVKLLMSFDPDAGTLDVQDPYYSEDSFFDHVLRQIESASHRLFRQIEPAIR